MNRTRFYTLLGMIISAAFLRMIPHPPNVTPVMAMALFGGAYIDNRRLAFLIPCAVMLASDAMLGFHRFMPFVYGAMAAAVLIGFRLRGGKNVIKMLMAAVLASVLFYLITNFGVWATGWIYPKTPGGLLECYAAALPFLRLNLLGNLIYTGLLFGGFSLLEKTFSYLKPAMISHSTESR